MKRILALVFAAVLILSLTGCAETMTLGIGKASRLDIISGVTGRTVELRDPGSIKRISDSLNSLKFRETGRLDTDGWSYALIWFGADGRCMDRLTALGDGRTIIHAGHVYTVRGPGGRIDLELIGSFLKAH